MKRLSNKQRWLYIVIVVLLIVVFINGGLEDRKETLARKPFFEEISEYQQNIKSEMIISILPDNRYIGKPIVDWKLEELALAMASDEGESYRPMDFLGSLTIEMDTTETEIESDVRLTLAYSHGERFFAYFELVIMQDGERYATHTFNREALNEWARNVGIADKENW